MPWFKLTGDARLGRCASENCGGQPTWRLEADGVGSDYCSGCRENIHRVAESGHHYKWCEDGCPCYWSACAEHGCMAASVTPQ